MSKSHTFLHVETNLIYYKVLHVYISVCGYKSAVDTFIFASAFGVWILYLLKLHLTWICKDDLQIKGIQVSPADISDLGVSKDVRDSIVI